MDCSTRLPCPSPSPSTCSNSCPLSWWYHLTISSSVVPFSSWLQSSPGSGSFPVNQLFTSGGQSNGDLASVLMNIQDWFPLRLTGWISLQFQGLSIVFSNTTAQKHQLFSTQLSLWCNSHIHILPLEKTRLWLQTFAGNAVSLLFNMPSRLVIAFFQGATVLYFQGCSHHLQWFWSQENKVFHYFHCFPIYLPWRDGTRCHHLHFMNVEF